MYFIINQQVQYQPSYEHNKQPIVTGSLCLETSPNHPDTTCQSDWQSHIIFMVSYLISLIASWSPRRSTRSVLSVQSILVLRWPLASGLMVSHFTVLRVQFESWTLLFIGYIYQNSYFVVMFLLSFMSQVKILWVKYSASVILFMVGKLNSSKVSKVFRVKIGRITWCHPGKYTYKSKSQNLLKITVTYDLIFYSNKSKQDTPYEYQNDSNKIFMVSYRSFSLLLIKSETRNDYDFNVVTQFLKYTVQSIIRISFIKFYCSHKL